MDKKQREKKRETSNMSGMQNIYDERAMVNC